MKTSDPYLILKPRCRVWEAPKKLLPYLDTVRRASDWQALGFSVKLDNYGFPLEDLSKKHEFSVAREEDPLIAEAIRTGKKAISHFFSVSDYVLAGCDLAEFVDLPEDVKAYCQGKLLLFNEEIEQALPLFESAVHLNPKEVRYREIYYPLRLALGDLSSIQEEFSFFEHDIDSIIHSGRFDDWVKALISSGEYQTAKQLISDVDIAISNLAAGSTTSIFYTKQEPWWYALKLEQFKKKAEKLLSRIQKLEEKLAHSVKQKGKGRNQRKV